jgi:hypothetical protein
MDPTDSVHLIRFLLPRPWVASVDCNGTCERTRERQSSFGANQRAAIAIARAPSSISSSAFIRAGTSPENLFPTISERIAPLHTL